MNRCMISATGRMIDIFDLQDEDIELAHIAHSLATKTRFNGSARVPYSIAQHCCLAAQNVNVSECMPSVALLHDAAEAYLLDVPSIAKKHPVFADYCLAEFDLQERIFHKYIPDYDDYVQSGVAYYKPIDVELLNHETRTLCVNWHLLDCCKGMPQKQIIIEPWTWQESERAFLLLTDMFGMKD